MSDTLSGGQRGWKRDAQARGMTADDITQRLIELQERSSHGTTLEDLRAAFDFGRQVEHARVDVILAGHRHCNSYDCGNCMGYVDSAFIEDFNAGDA